MSFKHSFVETIQYIFNNECPMVLVSTFNLRATPLPSGLVAPYKLIDFHFYVHEQYTRRQETEKVLITVD